MSKFAGKTVEELNRLDRDLELDWQHYDYQSDLHGDEDGHYAEVMRSIDAERDEIAEAIGIIEDANKAIYELEMCA